MSRVGLANFKLQAAVPNQHDKVWREGLNREQWDHLYHAMRVEDPKRKYTYKSAQTEGKDKFAKTWHIMSHIHSSAAGQGSYHYNVQKPVGNVQCYFPSASFSYVPHVTDSENAENRQLLKQTALFENAPQPQGLSDYILSRKHKDQLWNHSRGAKVDSRGAKVRSVSLRNLGYDKSTYNEAYYREGLFNSDSRNLHDGGVQEARLAQPGSLLLNHTHPADGRFQPGPWTRPRTMGATGSSINVAGAAQPSSADHRPATTGQHNASPAKSQHSSTPQVGDQNHLRLASTHSGGFFRDAHGAQNAYRNDVYDSTVGRFDQIRDNKSENGSHRGHKTFMDVKNDPSVTNPKIRYSKTVSGPFFQAGREQERATNNRTAAGPLNSFNKRTRQHPPRYETTDRDVPAARARRTNQPNAPSFQRVYAV
ncbi:unnamed protein product [Amoebophrya sp. A120]|nr:unnamed protein product [Amoebophrya sp. A120]|eukprot:GSA120T00001844001.1